MNPQTDDLEKIQVTLMQLRQEGTSKRKFPKELWDEIIRLTQIHSTKKICQQLKINPVYLKRKIHQSQKSPPLDFQEVPHHIQVNCPDNVVIDLSSNSGLRARIQGPLSCLSCLQSLFGM